MILTGQEIGRLGEKIACDYLLQNGFTILQKNFRARYAELDIVAQKNNKIHFIEVKTRVGSAKGKPYEAVDRRKIRSLERSISFYLLKNPHKECKLTLDLVSIILKPDLSVENLKYFSNINN